MGMRVLFLSGERTGKKALLSREFTIARDTGICYNTFQESKANERSSAQEGILRGSFLILSNVRTGREE